MKLRLIEHTLFKQKPLQSSELSYEEKVSLFPGTEFEINNYAEAENGHFQISLLDPLLNGKQIWYVYSSHVELTENLGEPAYFEVPCQVPAAPVETPRESTNLTWIWPMKGSSMGPETEFGYARGRLHAGIDIGGFTPDECYAASEGIVTQVKNDTSGGEGRAIYIQRSDGWQHVYYHLREILVKQGDSVSQGQLIAIRGGSGWDAEGVEIDGGGYSIHLHFEVHTPDGEPVDPRSVLPNDGSVVMV